MDLTSTLNKKSPSINRKWPIALLAIPLVIYSFWALSSMNSLARVSIDSVRLSDVKQGEFNVQVDGYGRLKAKYQRILTSQTQAIVESIHLYPGAKVTADTIILTLSDPQLEQEVVNARLELARQKAEMNEQIIAHKSELLERDAQIALLNSELENAQLRVQAEKQLVDKGIVSALDFKRTQLDVRQLGKRVEIERARQSQLKEMQKQRLSIQRDLITQYELNFQTINERFNRLTVRAGLEGVLQTLPIEIGQSVTPGTQLAMVGSDKQLVAQLRVQQRQADQINIGMSAVIKTSNKDIQAQVIRIDPIVTEGRVMVELDLLGDLPANARPDLSVEGYVQVQQITNALYVEQPTDSFEFKNKDIFKISADGKTALLTTIEFGTLSGNQIEIVKGVQRGDKIIVSDMSQWNTASKIQLTE